MNVVYNMDCMEGMKDYPDKYFDLAIVDPPYGINIGSAPGGGTKPTYHSEDSSRWSESLWGKEKSKKKYNDESGGVSLAHPKPTRHSMIPTSRMPHTLLK